MPACHAGDRRFESGRVRHPSHFPTPRPPARTGRSSAREAPGRPVRGTSVRLRPVKRDPGPGRARPRPRRPRGGARRGRPARPVRGLVAAPRHRPSPPAPTASTPRAARRPTPRRRRRCPVVDADRSARPDPAPPPAELADVAIVPVTHFRSPSRPRPARRRSRPCWPAPASATTALELVEGEADAILAALGVERPADPERLVLAADAATLAKDLAKNRKRLAFLRADDVGPAVRALAWGDTALFGVDRVEDLAAWPLTARLPAPTAGDAFDPATTWTLFAGGDIMLDRGVYQTPRAGQGRRLPVRRRHGRDHRPLQGLLGVRLGPARTRSGPATRASCATSSRAPTSRSPTSRTRRRTTRASTPRAPSSPPTRRCIDGLANAGIDYVSLANNHIRDAGGDRPAPDDHEPRRSAASTYSGAGKDLEGRPHAGASSRRPARRSRSSATTRSPAATTRPRPGSAAPPLIGQGRQGRRGRRRARPARTSSSSSRTGAPSTTRRRSAASRSWPR